MASENTATAGKGEGASRITKLDIIFLREVFNYLEEKHPDYWAALRKLVRKLPDNEDNHLDALVTETLEQMWKNSPKSHFEDNAKKFLELITHNCKKRLAAAQPGSPAAARAARGPAVPECPGGGAAAAAAAGGGESQVVEREGDMPAILVVTYPDGTLKTTHFPTVNDMCKHHVAQFMQKNMEGLQQDLLDASATLLCALYNDGQWEKIGFKNKDDVLRVSREMDKALEASKSGKTSIAALARAQAVLYHCLPEEQGIKQLRLKAIFDTASFKKEYDKACAQAEAKYETARFSRDDPILVDGEPTLYIDNLTRVQISCLCTRKKHGFTIHHHLEPEELQQVVMTVALAKLERKQEQEKLKRAEDEARKRAEEERQKRAEEEARERAEEKLRLAEAERVAQANADKLVQEEEQEAQKLAGKKQRKKKKGPNKSSSSCCKTDAGEFGECVVCLSGTRSYSLHPCEHAVLCYPCAKQILDYNQEAGAAAAESNVRQANLHLCPVCRQELQQPWVKQV